jgi:hypothetical protein
LKSISKFAIGALLGLFALASLCFAQGKQPPKAPVPPPPNPQLTAIEKRLGAIEQKVEPAGLDSRLAKIEDAVRSIKPTPLYMVLLPSVIAFFGALFGVYIGGRNAEKLQNARIAKDTEAAKEKARLDIAGAVVEFEIKQLSLLYGPLRAYLGQSEALYHEMNKVLVDRDNKLFRIIENAGQRPEFQIYDSGQWVMFRTVLHIFDVYGKDFGVEAYFDDIVAIGAEIVKIIHEQAGYARAEESDLMTIFGKYLAHFAVLKAMHDSARAKMSPPVVQGVPAVPHAPIVNASAAFPIMLHALVNQGFEAISKDIQQWRKQAGA